MSRNNEHEKIIVTTMMLNEGIVPIENTSHDVGRVLKQLPDDEARKLKRKFRKTWRKLAKAKEDKHNPDRLIFRYGKGKLNPSRWEREARKRLVYDHFCSNVARPILENFKRGGK